MLFGFLVFAILCHLGSSCKCIPMSIPKKYCKADFVMKVRATTKLKFSNGQKSWNAFYEIERLDDDPWKFRFEKDVNNKSLVYTASEGAACGVTLKKRKKYLISGWVDKKEKKMRISKCSSIVIRTNKLSRKTRKMERKPPNCQQLFAADKFKMTARRGR